MNVPKGCILQLQSRGQEIFPRNSMEFTTNPASHAYLQTGSVLGQASFCFHNIYIIILALIICKLDYRATGRISVCFTISGFFICTTSTLAFWCSVWRSCWNMKRPRSPPMTLPTAMHNTVANAWEEDVRAEWGTMLSLLLTVTSLSLVWLVVLYRFMSGSGWACISVERLCVSIISSRFYFCFRSEIICMYACLFCSSCQKCMQEAIGYVGAVCLRMGKERKRNRSVGMYVCCVKQSLVEQAV